MDFISIGPEAFANKELTVIAYKGENFYRACGVIVKVTRYSTSHCVKRVDHPGEIHEDWDGNTKDESKVDRPFFQEVSCALCLRILSATEPQFKCCPKHTSGPEVVCHHCYTTEEHGQKE